MCLSVCASYPPILCCFHPTAPSFPHLSREGCNGHVFIFPDSLLALKSAVPGLPSATIFLTEGPVQYYKLSRILKVLLRWLKAISLVFLSLWSVSKPFRVLLSEASAAALISPCALHPVCPSHECGVTAQLPRANQALCSPASSPELLCHKHPNVSVLQSLSLLVRSNWYSFISSPITPRNLLLRAAFLLPWNRRCNKV